MKFVLFYFWIGGWSMNYHIDKIAVFNKKEDCETVRVNILKEYSHGTYICSEENAIKE